MPAIVTNKFRLNNALQFYESFGEASPTVYYLFVGRPQPFSSSSGGGTDSAPPTPLDNVVDELMYYRDMIAAKKITSGDVSYACPRHNWTTGTVYDYYRGDYGATVNSATVTTVAGSTNMFSSTTKMYVRTSAGNVYMCMWNNGGAASTVEPTGTSTSELTTADKRCKSLNLVMPVASWIRLSIGKEVVMLKVIDGIENINSIIIYTFLRY